MREAHQAQESSIEKEIAEAMAEQKAHAAEVQQTRKELQA